MIRAQAALLGWMHDERSARILGAFALSHAAHQVLQSVGMFVRGAPVGPALALQTMGLMVLAIFTARRRIGLALGALGGGLGAVLVFPLTANHVYLGVVVSGLLALLSFDDEAERAQLVASLLVLPAIAFTWGGVTKLISGAWFEGQTLAHAFAFRPDLQASLGPLLSREVVAHLSQQNVLGDGAGPYRLEGPGRLLSNMVWIVELAVPGALVLVSAARRHAWWCIATLSLGMQWFAHEWEFALLLMNLSLLAAPSSVARIGRGLIIIAMASLAAVHAGLVEAPVWLIPSTVVRSAR